MPWVEDFLTQNIFCIACEGVEEIHTFRAQAYSAAADPRVLQILVSLRRASWLVVCLLALIFIVILLTR
jgi:hypothetical protein